MALNIKNPEVERLAGEVAQMSEETKTEAIRQGLLEYMERYVWPLVPASELGRVMSREEADEILGDGPEGV
jgi:antitoxin VapB